MNDDLLEQPPTGQGRGGGPKTEEGKKRSSLNALKHGLHAKSAHALRALEEVFDDQFDTLLEKVHSYYEPEDPVEDQLVKRIAHCVWRLERTHNMERRQYQRQSDRSRPGASCLEVLRYERMVDLQLHRALRALERRRLLKREIEKTNFGHAQARPF